MSWFDKLFGEDDKSATTRRSSQKRSQHQSSQETSQGLIPQTNDVYQRPRGKFRFPIDMHDAHHTMDETDMAHTTSQQTEPAHRHSDQRPSYTLDRRQRRHRNGVRVKGTETPSASDLQVSRSNTLSTHYRRPSTTYRANGARDTAATRQQETRPAYHRPDFKASEVPSAIFGTKARREIKNSGLKQPQNVQANDGHTTRDVTKTTRQAPVKRPTSTSQRSKKQATPNYSKRDNTINIENIYASQIVEEIRREREKKVLQKKRFKESLEQKKAAQQQDDSSDIQQAIDAMHAQQAKQLLGAAYDMDDTDNRDVSEVLEDADQVEVTAQDESANEYDDQYQYEEVDLSQYADAHDEVQDSVEDTNSADVATVEARNNVERAHDDIDHHDNAEQMDDSADMTQGAVNEPVSKDTEVQNPDDATSDFDTHDFEDNTEMLHEEDMNNDAAAVVSDEPKDGTTERDEQAKRPVVAPILKPTVAQHGESTVDMRDDEAQVTAQDTIDETDVSTASDVEDATERDIDAQENEAAVVQDEPAHVEADDGETADVGANVETEPAQAEVQQASRVTAHETEAAQGETAESTEPVQAVEATRPTHIRRKAKPFNVVMTPSDKKRHMERQQQQRQAITHRQATPMTNTSSEQQQTVQRGSERVTSPELIDTTTGQGSEKPNTPVAEKKIRRGPMIHLPSLDLLDAPEVHERDEAWIAEKKQELNDAFYYFNVPAEVVNVIEGPSVTRFELSVEKGVKVSRITALQDDIKMALAAKDIRIEAPIPGTSLVGIEVPNQNPMKVNLRAIIESDSFKNASSKLTVAMGNRINNEPLLMDIAKTPHALIAGATGSGKSVSINSILISLLYRNHPEELKLLLIDPKMVELAPYNDLPHLVAPVITDVKAATQSLKWAVEEMERRYKLFAQAHVRNITAFNKKVSYDQRIPKIVIVIDELADLMMMAPQEVEQSIARIAQKARACGIHMLVATQRPSVNVITGLIKANIPTRIAFMVSSSVDSRTILDSGGAERLLGYGDMLYLGGGMNKPIRVQGTFVSDDEIDRVVDFIKAQRGPEYLFQEQELLKKTETPAKDELFYEVCEFMVREQSISTSLIQRHFQIGYNRAARIIDQLEQLGYISGANGSKPRDVYLTESELSEL
ncbi:MAG: DNA translocase FtsK [Staphylococcus rostri]|uniref:DNA translocase FtsK n=1 Tax=Staphylococcus rostri TaxID=522262 RepID=UPI0026DFFF09|nr:DNA translocase FtsK [Staphylococcus rostri]MDO5374908.1 DNA translocase FtsK [Staphylococcus rostri]